MKLLLIIIFIFSYFIGSIPFGLLIGKLYKIDLRIYGSKNIGATNVIRIINKQAGFICFILDFLKGSIPIFLFLKIIYPILQLDIIKYYNNLPILIVFITILGHIFPIYLSFKGGKGISTTFGGLIILYPIAVCIGISIWLFIYFIYKIVSIASIFSTLTIICYSILLYNNDINYYTIIILFFILILIVNKHKSNIINIIYNNKG